jgi:hypothetical protein
LSGEDAGDADGLHFTAGDSMVTGLVINRWSGAGLVIDGNNVGVWGNFIGTDSTGTVAAPNAAGIAVWGPWNSIQGNVVSGNTGPGVELFGTGSRVLSNMIGLDVSGTTALGNSVGVIVHGPQSEIGWPSAPNTLSGNLGPGILVHTGASETKIVGNRIGTNASGSPGFGNGGDGILVIGAPGVLIGETAWGNNIVANGGHGIALIGVQDALVRGNRSTGNGGSGIWLEGGSNRIGDPLNENVVAFNDGDGISIAGATSVGNNLEGNSIHSNGGLGIDLGADGYTSNDDLDADTGANELQNHPTILSARLIGTEIRVDGELRSKPSSVYRINVFGSTACDPSGAGEGEWWFAISDVLTDSSGLATFSVFFTTPLPVAAITATARDAAGNTSEFSPCVVPDTTSTTSTNPTVSSSTTLSSSTTTTTVPDSGGCVWAGDTCPWLACEVGVLGERADDLACGRNRTNASIRRLARRVQRYCESEHPAPRRFEVLVRRVQRRDLAVKKLEERCALTSASGDAQGAAVPRIGRRLFRSSLRQRPCPTLDGLGHPRPTDQGVAPRASPV